MLDAIGQMRLGHVAPPQIHVGFLKEIAIMMMNVVETFFVDLIIALTFSRLLLIVVMNHKDLLMNFVKNEMYNCELISSFTTRVG